MARRLAILTATLCMASPVFAEPLTPVPGGSRAMAVGVGGVVKLKCTVMADGSVSACVVLSEDPTNYGLGDAALRLSKEFHMKPKTSKGEPVGGAQVIIPIRFHIPEAPSVTLREPPAVSLREADGAPPSKP